MAQPAPYPTNPGPPATYGQPAPYPGPPPAYGQPAQHVVIQQPVVYAAGLGFRESPVRTQCPHCNNDVITATTYTTGTYTWVLCVILFFIGCDLGCCLIPFCLDGCKDVIHTCPNCQQQLGVFNRM